MPSYDPKYKYKSNVIDNVEDAKEIVRNVLMGPNNPTDTATLDIPLLIRLLEYSKEDAQSDMDLHKVAENIIELSKQGKTLTMSDYNNIVSISND